jgi:hypothetical protein
MGSSSGSSAPTGSFQVYTFCFFSVPFSSGSNRIWNICSTLASVEDIYRTCDKPTKHKRNHMSYLF